MIIFGFEITRLKKPGTVAVDPALYRIADLGDWMKNHTKPIIYISPSYKPATEAYALTVHISCNHKGNEVSSNHASGSDISSAFQAALKNIEKTIGSEWHASLPISDPHELSPEKES